MWYHINIKIVIHSNTLAQYTQSLGLHADRHDPTPRLQTPLLLPWWHCSPANSFPSSLSSNCLRRKSSENSSENSAVNGTAWTENHSANRRALCTEMCTDSHKRVVHSHIMYHYIFLRSIQTKKHTAPIKNPEWSVFWEGERVLNQSTTHCYFGNWDEHPCMHCFPSREYFRFFS